MQMNTTTVIIILLLVVTVVILVKFKKSSGQSELEPDFDQPKETEVPKLPNTKKSFKVHKKSDTPKDLRRMIERVRVIQQNYWTPNPDEKKRLRMKGVDDLAWGEALRLLHLVCLEMLSNGPCREQLLDETIAFEASAGAPAGENRDLIVRLAKRLSSESSPYKPRHTAVWRGKAGESDKREPDLQGVFRNASITHLGCFEVIRLDSKQQPHKLAFISLDEMRGAVFAGSAFFRLGKFFFDDGRPDETLLVPLLYGISWLSSHDFDRNGSSTRFICAIEIGEDQQDLVIGVGQQDFVMEGDGQTLLGLGSIGEIMTALFVDDPKFDQKCRARGLDPDAVRQSMIK
jgi:hypothetical protein